MSIEQPTTYQLLNRLKTVAGHLRGVQRMVETQAYCIDIIKQTQAVQRALDKVSSLLLEAHLNGEVTGVLRTADQDERARIVNQLLAVFHLAAGSAPSAPSLTDVNDRTAWLQQLEEQVRALQDLLETDSAPVQTIAGVQQVQRMLNAFQGRVLADHLNGCVTTAIRSDQPAERERVVRELLQVFTASTTLG
ncbi:MAG: metal-sensing transcriptional repressor [Chloroflexaceae bacterium]|nr:metal-sensing transcriptional repressor [Chloroflexaceae bacterium]NJL34080.1 metal-sensing transcriptional repressor [Chloroflexaceae bacterium]NJO04086.1 metal-sensing transcriptional repressor [Chloroflexaceae bacterium]